MTVSGLNIKVESKPIKSLYVGVYPPEGHVRVAAPKRFTKEAVRLAVIDKLAWIKKQQQRFNEQERQSKREMVDGESHYFLGNRYRLRVIERWGAHTVELKNSSYMVLYVRPGTSPKRREQVLQDWYRKQLKKLVSSILPKWQQLIGVKTSDFRVRKMKTKWGSCSQHSRSICLNLELAKKPFECLEYVVVHELVHLIERKHDDRFISLIDKALPNWRAHRDLLNSQPLAHQDWTCE